MIVVVAKNLNARGAVPDDILLKGDLLDLAPRATAVLVAHGEHDGVPRLAALPVCTRMCSA